MVQKQNSTFMIPQYVQSAILQRQGFAALGEMDDLWSSIEIEQHFKEFYTVIPLDADEDYILEKVLASFEDGEIEEMMHQYKIANPFECAKVAGYLTELHDHYIMSVTYPDALTKKADYHQ